MKTILNRIVFLCYNLYRIEGSKMYIKDNNNIGFKLFWMFILFAGAIFVDVCIIKGVSGSDFDIEKFLNSLFYYDVDHTGCDVQLTHDLSINERYTNYINLEEEDAKVINDLMEKWDIEEIDEYNDWGPPKYIIDSCDTTLYYNDESDLIEYNGKMFDGVVYKEQLNEIINRAIQNDKRPRLYVVEDVYGTTSLEPVYFSEQDASDIYVYWANDPKTVSESFFTVNGKYQFVIGDDVILLDNSTLLKLLQY